VKRRCIVLSVHARTCTQPNDGQCEVSCGRSDSHGGYCRSPLSKRRSPTIAFLRSTGGALEGTDPLERILRKTRRRARMAGSSPGHASALNPAATGPHHTAYSEWPAKRYLSMDLLKDHTQNQSAARVRASPGPNAKVRKTLKGGTQKLNPF